jgi:hypothetical protein
MADIRDEPALWHRVAATTLPPLFARDPCDTQLRLVIERAVFLIILNSRFVSWQWCVGTVISLLAMGATVAEAVPLLPGSTVFPTGTTVTARPELAGTVIDSKTSNFEVGLFPFIGDSVVKATGTVTSTVVRTAGGTLDFQFSVANNTSSSVAIEQFRVEGFFGTADVDFRTDLTGTRAVGEVVRFGGNLGFSEQFINFDFRDAAADSFEPNLLRGETSYTFFVKTAATEYLIKTSDLTSPGYFSLGVPIFAPAPVVVPEPTALAILIGGLVTLSGRPRRRRL